MFKHNKKYKLTRKYKVLNLLGGEVKVYQIKALKSFKNVSKGELGGWVQGTFNLSQDDESWISRETHVIGSARVSGNSLVKDSTLIGTPGQEYTFHNSIGIHTHLLNTNIQSIGGPCTLIGVTATYSNLTLTNTSIIKAELSKCQLELVDDMLVGSNLYNRDDV